MGIHTKIVIYSAFVPITNPGIWYPFICSQLWLYMSGSHNMN